MNTYAACVSNVVIAFINDDGSGLPEGFNCYVVDNALVQNNTIRAGMIRTGNTFIEAPRTVPQKITAAQAKLALHNAGILPTVEAGVAAYKPMEIFFHNSNEWNRGHVYVQGLGAQLGLTDEQIDDLFVAAALL